MIYCAFVAASVLAAPPVVIVDADNTRIDRSCTVRLPAGRIIADPDHNGVIQIAADDITVEFEDGSILQGAAVGEGPDQTPWDRLEGIGIRLDGHSGVTLRGLQVRGYRVGLYATAADRLTIDHASFADNFRQHLGSTPQAEDSADWLWPHENDDHQWMDRYGGALVVERSADTTLRSIRVRTGQNGIILDRVTRSSIFDCDCSFLSGWGIALWRSSNNLISRNALDFCVRGYSHRVYNRGQDSAGILCFEQSKDNAFIENSVTHGGDGFFGFAGKEALGESTPPAGFDYAAAGCDRNLFVRNDLSYAVAHGLELTFSNECLVQDNRFVDNAICGIWGGYSNGWTVRGNIFERNGAMGYGSERGAINIEHGGSHRVVENIFLNNRVALHLWWDDDAQLLQRPGVKARYQGPRDNVFAGNLVRIDANHPFPPTSGKPQQLLGVEIRDPMGSHALQNRVASNVFDLTTTDARAMDLARGVTVLTEPAPPAPMPTPVPEPRGTAQPVGGRLTLRGREHIIMTPWGPWDHESPLVRFHSRSAGGDRWQAFGLARPRVTVDGPVDAAIWPLDGYQEIQVRPRAPGYSAYTIAVMQGDNRYEHHASILSATWDCRAFASPVDPRQDLAAWREAAAKGVPFQVTGSLDLPLARGLRSLAPLAPLADARDSLPNTSNYGITASTTIPLPAGTWRVRTNSDDGIRVRLTRASGVQTLLENWTHHGPTTDEASFQLPAAEEVHLEVEYFQLDGYAVLAVELLPMP